MCLTLVFKTSVLFVLCTELDPSEASLIIEGEEFVCPICHGEPFELETLIKHMDNERAIQQRSAVYCWLTSICYYLAADTIILHTVPHVLLE